MANVADKLASKINGNSSDSRLRFFLSQMWPQKVANFFFFAAHVIGNRQHDKAQNERSLSGDEFIPAE